MHEAGVGARVVGAAVGTQHLMLLPPGQKPENVAPEQTETSRHFPDKPDAGVHAWAGTQQSAPGHSESA